ncbi:MAG: hypothetical protein ACRCZP_13035 [Phycicoccus sp.]
MPGLAGQKVRITETGYTTTAVGERLRAADVPGGQAVAGTVLKASQ